MPGLQHRWFCCSNLVTAKTEKTPLTHVWKPNAGSPSRDHLLSQLLHSQGLITLGQTFPDFGTHKAMLHIGPCSTQLLQWPVVPRWHCNHYKVNEKAKDRTKTTKQCTECSNKDQYIIYKFALTIYFYVLISYSSRWQDKGSFCGRRSCPYDRGTCNCTFMVTISKQCFKRITARFHLKQMHRSYLYHERIWREHFPMQ